MKSLATAQLYGILDLGYVAAEEVERVTEKMLEGGVDVLQLRAKGLDESDIEGIANRILPLTEGAGVPLILNDFPQLVPSVGAQGAHVGQDDFAVDDARWRAGLAFDALKQAQAEGADYIGFGPLFATPTKPGRPAIGLDDIRQAHEQVTVPIFCIGGIKLENLPAIVAAGARRVVIVSGLLQAPDIADYARRVKALLPRLAESAEMPDENA